MKGAVTVLATGVFIALATSTASAQTADGHKMMTPQDVKWGPGPASLPSGAQVAVIYGDPSKDAPFAMRIKAPKGYVIPPHTHPKPEIVTVISGTVRLGMGETADPAKAQALPAGGFFVMTPGMVHYFIADEDTVVQLNSTGPWGLAYVNPKDDPRQKTQ